MSQGNVNIERMRRASNINAHTYDAPVLYTVAVQIGTQLVLEYVRLRGGTQEHNACAIARMRHGKGAIARVTSMRRMG